MTNKPLSSADKRSQTKIRRIKPKIRPSLLSKKLLIRGEDKRKFEELRAKIMEEILPCTEIEKILCDKFISAVWKHTRAIEIEKNMLSAQNIPENNDEQGDSLDFFDSRFDTNIKRRVRNIKKVNLDRDEVQKILKYQIALEKNMLKMLERLYNAKASRKGLNKHSV